MKTIPTTISAILLAFAILNANHLSAQGNKPVTITISNIPSNQGKVMLTTANGKYYAMTDATAPTVSIQLDNIPDGEYTIYVFHDANGNYILDKEDDIPTEYCATWPIEVSKRNRSFSIELMNVMEKVKGKNHEQK